MLAKRIIPCLDVHEGRVVKGINFVNLKDAGDPVEMASIYDKEGADELVFLDITATVEKRKNLTTLVEKIAREINIPFTVGGGINSVDDARAIIKAGADKVSINTSAVNRPELITKIAEQFGSQCVVIAIDTKLEPEGWKVYTHGGRTSTPLFTLNWAKEAEQRGAGEILLTSLDEDGVQNGYDIEVTKAVADAVGIPVIASGGAGKLEDFYDGVVKGHAAGVLAASLFHDGVLSVKEVKEYLSDKGIDVKQ